ncbi:MAG: hypothetical protein JNK78_14080 [Planctomycetes bacterium]|nr:hypothetical protein [Planctomycetota bacterium]
MLVTKLLPFAAAALLTTAAFAQVNCSDNLWPLRLVNANGVPAPSTLDPSTGRYTYKFANESVYLAFDPTIASGTYYVHVTSAGLEEVVSTNDPMDRFVSVENNAGVISLSLPFTNNQDPAVYGLGLGGQGQSILLKFRSSEFTPCSWKVLLGDKWDLTYGPTHPYLIDGGIHPVTGQCAVRSYDGFVIGDGNGSDVTGSVFRDADRDGVRDAGETGLGGWEVRLVSEGDERTALTDATGAWRFANVPKGTYTVELEVKTGYVATAAATREVNVCECADLAVQQFAVAQSVLPCNAKPVCFWKSKNGRNKCNTFHWIPALHLVNNCGGYVAPGSRDQIGSFFGCANSWNMGNQLSSELLAMHCNVVAGYVHPDCVIQDPTLGQMTIGQLLQRAAQSLACHPYTPVWHSQRQYQTCLKNALERANDNRIWR